VVNRSDKAQERGSAALKAGEICLGSYREVESAGQHEADPTRTGEFAGKLHSDLSKRIIGQEQAVEQVVNIYQMFMTGMSAVGRPIGNFSSLAQLVR